MMFGPKTPPKRAPAETEPKERPANAFEAAWPFNADSPHVADVARDDQFLSTMLVDVTGLDWDTIADCLPTVRDTARTKNMVPILIVDLVEFQGLIKEGLAYDTVPNVAANAALAPELDWSSYLTQRRHLLKEKWQPAAIINLSPNADWDAS